MFLVLSGGIKALTVAHLEENIKTIPVNTSVVSMQMYL